MKTYNTENGSVAFICDENMKSVAEYYRVGWAKQKLSGELVPTAWDMFGYSRDGSQWDLKGEVKE